MRDVCAISVVPLGRPGRITRDKRHMTRERGNHRTASIGVNITGASLLDTGMIAASGPGITLAANEPPGKTNTIAGNVDHTVSIGEGGYTRHLTITSTGAIVPSAGGANGVYIPATVSGATLLKWVELKEATEAVTPSRE